MTPQDKQAQEALALTDADVTAIHRLPYVRDCLLRYVRRPCDEEASAIVRAIADQIAALSGSAQSKGE